MLVIIQIKQELKRIHMTIDPNLPSSLISFEGANEETIPPTYIHRLMESVKNISHEVRKKIPTIIALSVTALTAFYLYRKFTSSADVPKIDVIPDKIRDAIEGVVKANQSALKENGYLSHILFCGPSKAEQETAAKALAAQLGLPFYCFDGGDNGKEIVHRLVKLVRTDKTHLLFVSQADRLVSKETGWLGTLLAVTGSVSKKQLLCLGAPSRSSLYPDLASRSGQVIKILD